MERSDIEAPLRILTAIAVAFGMGVILFAIAAHTLLMTGVFASEAIEPSLLPIITPVLLFVMAGGLVVGRRLEGAIPRDASTARKIQRYSAARIVAMASQEGSALAIMVLSMMAGSRTWIIGAAAVGVWTVFLARPRREDLEALLKS